jgi:hypothetical protein
MRKVTVLKRRAIADEILEAVRNNQDCQLDKLAVSLPFATWAQVFMEVGRLSRNGQLHVTVGPRNCTLRLAEEGTGKQDRSEV